MSELTLSLLGPPRFTRGDVPIDLSPNYRTTGYEEDILRHRIWWILLCVILMLSACRERVPAQPSILSLEEIPGGFEGPSITDDTGTSVIVHFTSGVPTACNVTYGTDTDYGAIATSTMMMGGGIREHDVALTGLTPETAYHYRVNLTDEKARLYQSQDLTFTTSAAESESDQQREGDNVASLVAGAQVVGISSNYGGGDNAGTWGANNAIDGQPNTAWSSNGDGDDAWIEIELAQEVEVQAIGFWTRTMANGTAQILQFTATTDRGETFGPFDLPDANSIHTFPVEFTARRLRFDAVESSGGNTGAVEIEVYGVPHR
jgi:hypothetical protein